MNRRTSFRAKSSAQAVTGRAPRSSTSSGTVVNAHTQNQVIITRRDTTTVDVTVGSRADCGHDVATAGPLGAIDVPTKPAALTLELSSGPGR